MFVTDNHKVGDVIMSVLSEADFVAEHGAGWVLMDSRSINPSVLFNRYGVATAYDMRGMTPKGHNGSRADGKEDPEAPALGSFQAQSVQHHVHSWWDYTGVNGRSYIGDGSVFNYPAGIAAGVSHSPSPEGNQVNSTIYTSGVTQMTGISQVTGITNEPVNRTARTRVHSVILNFFMKIN